MGAQVYKVAIVRSIHGRSNEPDTDVRGTLRTGAGRWTCEWMDRYGRREGIALRRPRPRPLAVVPAGRILLEALHVDSAKSPARSWALTTSGNSNRAGGTPCDAHRRRPSLGPRLLQRHRRRAVEQRDHTSGSPSRPEPASGERHMAPAFPPGPRPGARRPRRRAAQGARSFLFGDALPVTLSPRPLAPARCSAGVRTDSPGLPRAGPPPARQESRSLALARSSGARRPPPRPAPPRL